MSRVADTATEWAFSTGWTIVRRMPEAAAARVFQEVADRSWRKRGPAVVQLERNLARVRPGMSDEDLRALSREGMRRYMRYYCEAFRLPAWSKARLRDGVQLAGVEALDTPVRDGRGVVVVGAHMGNWDLAGAWGAQRFGSVSTVVERLKPEGLFQQFLAFRESLGIHAMATGDAGIVSHLVRVARDGGVVALVGDRDLSGNGIDVDFLGEAAPFPVGPAVISMLSGSPLVVITTWYDGATLRGQCETVEPAPAGLPRDERIQILTQRVADLLARAISAHPEDWHMLQRLWPSDQRVAP